MQNIGTASMLRNQLKPYLVSIELLQVPLFFADIFLKCISPLNIFRVIAELPAALTSKLLFRYPLLEHDHVTKMC